MWERTIDHTIIHRPKSLNGFRYHFIDRPRICRISIQCECFHTASFILDHLDCIFKAFCVQIGERYGCATQLERTQYIVDGLFRKHTDQPSSIEESGIRNLAEGLAPVTNATPLSIDMFMKY